MLRISTLVLAFFYAGMLMSCNSKEKRQQEHEEINSKLPVITLLEEAEYDFGTVREGDIVEQRFNFRNEGSLPLVISNVTASCGCTTPEWPRDPVSPGKEGSILVKFNTKGKPGSQVKTISVYANTNPPVVELKLKGQVDAAADKDSK